MDIQEMLKVNPEMAGREIERDSIRLVLNNMISHGLARYALKAAHVLGMEDVAKKAAQIVMILDGHENNELARQYLSDTVIQDKNCPRKLP